MPLLPGMIKTFIPIFRISKTYPISFLNPPVVDYTVPNPKDSSPITNVGDDGVKFLANCKQVGGTNQKDESSITDACETHAKCFSKRYRS